MKPQASKVALEDVTPGWWLVVPNWPHNRTGDPCAEEMSVVNVEESELPGLWMTHTGCEMEVPLERALGDFIFLRKLDLSNLAEERDA